MEEENKQEEIISEKSDVIQEEKTVVTEPKMSVVQKIILCLMSAGLLFGAASLHEFVPLIGLVAYFIYPIVVANLTYRYGYVMSVSAVLIAHCLIGALWSPYAARSVTLSVGVIGLLFGFCFRKKYTGKRTFFTVAGIYIGALLLLQQFISAGGFLGAIAEEAYLQTVFARKLVNALRYDVAQLVLEMPEQFVDGVGSALFFLFGSMIPTIFICQQAVLIWLYYLVIGFTMKKMGHEIAVMPALSTWRTPRWMFWTALVVAVLDGFIPIDVSGFSVVCVNVLLCAVLFFMACGIGVFWHYLRFSQVSLFLKIVAVGVVIYFLQYGLGAALIIGALDALFDFRKLKKPLQPIADTGAAAVEWEKQEEGKLLKETAKESEEKNIDAVMDANIDTNEEK